MSIHKLKILPDHFNHVESGAKTFEVRKNDRYFSVGDKLVLEEYDLGYGKGYTGRTVSISVIHVLPGDQFGIKEGFCVLGLGPVMLPHSADTLRPCPFCGGKAHLLSEADNDFDLNLAIDEYKPECMECNASTQPRYRQVAIDEWNGGNLGRK